MLTPTLPTSLWDAIPSINLTVKRSFPRAGGVGSAPFPQLQTQMLCHSPAFIFRGLQALCCSTVAQLRALAADFRQRISVLPVCSPCWSPGSSLLWPRCYKPCTGLQRSASIYEHQPISCQPCCCFTLGANRRNCSRAVGLFPTSLFLPGATQQPPSSLSSTNTSQLDASAHLVSPSR